MITLWAKRNWFSLLLFGLLLVIAVLKYRDGMIGVDGTDLATNYSATRAWLDGTNPYDFANLLQHFQDAGGHDVPEFRADYMPPIYPPVTFVVTTPIALLSWDHALLAWKIAAPIMFALIVGSLANLAGLRWWDWRTALLVLFCITFAPVRNAITLAQNAVPALCLAMLATVALRYRRPALAGCLLALAISFKFQDALFVLAYFALNRHWRAIGWCVGAGVGLLLIALLIHTPLHPGWIFDVLPWIRKASQPGSIIDPSSANGARFQMIRLSVLLFTFISSPVLVSMINWIICGSLFFLIAMWIAPNLLTLSALGALSLLPIYHRFPDAIILLLPMAWAVGKLGTAEEKLARVTLLLLLLFLLQPAEVISSLVHRGTISHELNQAWWWQCFARASLIWAILLLCCWLISLMRKCKS